MTDTVNINLRIWKGLHDRLKKYKESLPCKQSLNSIIIEAIQSRLDFRSPRILIAWNGVVFPTKHKVLREMRWTWTSKPFVAHYFGGYPLGSVGGEHLFMEGDVKAKTWLVDVEDEEGDKYTMWAAATEEDVAKAVIKDLKERGMDI